MPIRIDQRTVNGRVVMTVAGALRAEDVGVLEAACAAARAPLALDLAELRTACGPGAEALRRLAAGGVELTGVTPYVALLLAETPPAAERLGLKESTLRYRKKLGIRRPAGR